MLPVVRDPGCVVCGGPVTTASWTQLPLLRHAGYGEAAMSEVERCVSSTCGSVREAAVLAVNPRVALREP